MPVADLLPARAELTADEVVLRMRCTRCGARGVREWRIVYVGGSAGALEGTRREYQSSLGWLANTTTGTTGDWTIRSMKSTINTAKACAETKTSGWRVEGVESVVTFSVKVNAPPAEGELLIGTQIIDLRGVEPDGSVVSAVSNSWIYVLRWLEKFPNKMFEFRRIWRYLPTMTSVEIMTIPTAFRGSEAVEADAHDLDPEFYRIVVRRGRP